MRPHTIVYKKGDYLHVERTAVLGADRARCGCGKQTYANRKLAKAVAKKAQRDTGEVIEAYHCDRAHGWHIGHPIGLRSRVA